MPADLRPCPRCSGIFTGPDRFVYAYLFGMYLGDGSLSLMKRGVYRLRVSCADDYPGVMAEVSEAVADIRNGGAVCRAQRVGCTDVIAYWKHWPCLFPQHGPGRKHERRIELADWQRELVEQDPGRFLRGLFHSDGCRITNWTAKEVNGERRLYEYPRYFFKNTSADILALCGWALDLLQIEWRRPGPTTLSVARRSAVAALDTHVGPKY
jgi:hypothetical protein